MILKLEQTSIKIPWAEKGEVALEASGANEDVTVKVTSGSACIKSATYENGKITIKATNTQGPAKITVSYGGKSVVLNVTVTG